MQRISLIFRARDVRVTPSHAGIDRVSFASRVPRKCGHGPDFLNSPRLESPRRTARPWCAVQHQHAGFGCDHWRQFNSLVYGDAGRLLLAQRGSPPRRCPAPRFVVDLMVRLRHPEHWGGHAHETDSADDCDPHVRGGLSQRFRRCAVQPDVSGRFQPRRPSDRRRDHYRGQQRAHGVRRNARAGMRRFRRDRLVGVVLRRRGRFPRHVRHRPMRLRATVQQRSEHLQLRRRHMLQSRPATLAYPDS